MLFSTSRDSCFVFLVLVFLSWGPRKGLSSTAEPALADDDEEEEVPSTHVPSFISKPLTISVLQGESAKFPCEVDDLGTFATVWRKGDKDVLFANSIRIARDQNYQRLEDRSLQVRRSRPTDDGDYVCVISSNPTVELKHTLTVLIPPKITTKIKNHVTTSKGQPFHLNCEASGTPEPTITWKRLDGVFPDSRPIHEGGVVYMEQSTRHQAGTYECIASNGVGDPDTHTVRVHVNYSPEVEPVSSWVHAGEETSAEVTCKVRAHPVATITWKGPGGTPITESERFHMKSNGGEHSLQIKQMRKEDFGDYVCEASNVEGSDTATITVSGLASPAEFQSDPRGELPNDYVLKWVTRSHSTVIDYILRIKAQKEDSDWREIRVTADSQQHGVLKTQSYEMTGLEAATPYEAVVIVQNKFGNSQPSRHFVFYTHGAAAAPRKETHVLTEQAAGDHAPSQGPAQPQQQNPDEGGNGNAAPAHFTLSSVAIILLSVVLWF